MSQNITLPAVPLHVIFRRKLAAQPNRLTNWEREWIQVSLDVLELSIQAEIAGLLRAWPTPECRRALERSNPQCFLWIRYIEILFWLGHIPEAESNIVGNIQLPLEIQSIADRIHIRQVEWAMNLDPILLDMSEAI